MVLVLSTLAWLSLAFLAGTVPFLGHGLHDASPAAFAAVAAIPAISVLESAALFWLHARLKAGGLFARSSFLLLLGLSVLLVNAMLGDHHDPLQLAFPESGDAVPMLLSAFAASLGLYAALRLAGPWRIGPRELAGELLRLGPPEGGTPPRVQALALLSAGAALSALLAFGPERGPFLNSYGLVCFPPGKTVVDDSSANASADGYPPAVNRYNSLGYRDLEPSGTRQAKRRILVVGDSFVWGLGIPDNERTLPALLREKLEAAAPGRFDVVAAGFPANGLYGYARAVTALAPALDAEAAVVVYLGGNDHDPLDSQAIMDRSPRNPLLRSMVNGLRVRQFVHAAARRVLGRPGGWDAERTLAQAQRAADELAAFAGARKMRLVFLQGYFEASTGLRLPEGAEALDLPRGLAFPGQGSPYWYGKDAHPKPLLNEAAAELLAARLATGSGSGPSYRAR
ncbi:MAG: SGNH/GDSL hydrolase family protein [Elusimicrobia bacterium]|nr:SGNH/GDSL hydrolase family protein [Elusimicrobiota bacterium]